MAHDRALVVDADSHAVEVYDEVLALLDPALRPLAPRFEVGGDGRVVLTSLEGRPWTPPFAFESSPQLERAQRRVGPGSLGARDRVSVLDAEGIDLAIIVPSLGLYFGMYRDPEVAAALCRAENRWLGTWCAAAPARLAPLAVLPQQDPGLAARELERAVVHDGAVGGMVRPNPAAGRLVAADDFDDLWSAAASLDVPIVFHEGWLGGGCPTVGLDRALSYAGGHVMSHVFEAMSSMLALAERRVLERHPDLRLGFFEAGCGWAPWWQARIADHGAMRTGQCGGAEVLSERVWLSAGPDEVGLDAVAGSSWGSNVCFATDYPHLDASHPGAVASLRARRLAPSAERALLGENALRLFGPRLEARLSRPSHLAAGRAPTSVASAQAPATSVTELLRRLGTGEVAHSGGTLLDHLDRTGAILEAWQARPAVVAAGRLHSIYGTEAFPAAVGAPDRADVRRTVGSEAEALAWAYGRCSIASLVRHARSGSAPTDRDGTPVGGAVAAADLCEIAVANLLEQRPRLPGAAQKEVLDQAGALEPVIGSAARRAVELASSVEPDEAAFHRWAASSSPVVTLDLGGRREPEEPWRPARALGDRPALASLIALADELRSIGWDGASRDGAAIRLALHDPVPLDEVTGLLGAAGVDALVRTGCLECRDPQSGRASLRFGLMPIGREIAVVPLDGRTGDAVYFGFEPLLLHQAAGAIAPHATRALECGAGAGLASLLLARRCAVVATDVLHRATGFLALTRALNGHLADRLHIVTADGGDGLRPGSFDLVLANPPHVPGPAGSRAMPVYAAGGPTGCELPVRLLHECVGLLAPGGALVFLGIDWSLHGGRRPLAEALDALGGYRWAQLSTPWPHLVPGALERLVAQHRTVVAGGAHVGILVVRPDDRTASTAQRRLADASAALAGLGWLPAS